MVKIFDEIYSTFGLTYQIELSTMPEDHMGDEKIWHFAEETLQAAIQEMGKDSSSTLATAPSMAPSWTSTWPTPWAGPGSAAPSSWTSRCPSASTWSMWERTGEKHRPVMIHRALLGSIERFIGVITEHFAGAFPVWLSPVQVKVLPVTDRAAEYADQVAAQLTENGFRVEVDHRNEKIGKKIREAQLEKTPYMLVVGDRDMENGTVSPRHRAAGDLGAMSLADFQAKLRREVDEKLKDSDL